VLKRRCTAEDDPPAPSKRHGPIIPGVRLFISPRRFLYAERAARPKGVAEREVTSALEIITNTERANVGDGRTTRGRQTNAALRTREHLAEHEVERLIAVAKGNRYGRRDALMILLAYRHALRASEVVDLRWDQVDMKAAHLDVRRAKNGLPSTHPLPGRELRELRKHQREQDSPSPFVFVSERGAPLTAPGFSRMVERAGVEADLGIKVHAHMLRHSCGYKLAGDGRDTHSIQMYLGHRNIQNTARYMALSPGRFRDFWRD
jgi:type 1 fimbriae regulatory protein FimB/type 1 fimbriae regulatory protein FimE